MRKLVYNIIFVYSACCLLLNPHCIAQVLDDAREKIKEISDELKKNEIKKELEDAHAGGEDDSIATEEIDVSDKHLKVLEKLQDFYISQNKKTKIPESLMMKYQTGLKNTEEEISLIREKRIEHAKKVQQTEPTLLETELFKFNFRDMDIALRMNESPAIYANEIGSWVFNGSVSFLSLKKYNAPVTISGEKVLNEKISVGGYIGHLVEKVRVNKNYLDSNEFFSANKINYKHSYYTIGLKGSYHFFNPLFILNPVKFDLYVTAIAGYSIAAATIPFLDNEKYLRTGVDGTETDGQYNAPGKKGFNYGAFAGLRYMYDNNIGFFVEAGYSNTGYVTGGLTIRFLGKNVSGKLEEDIIEFKVQIYSSKRMYKPDHSKFKGLPGVEAYINKNMYIYTVTGEGTSYGAATVLQTELNQTTFKKAFVVALKNGKPIKVKKALKLLTKTEVE